MVVFKSNVFISYINLANKYQDISVVLTLSTPFSYPSDCDGSKGEQLQPGKQYKETLESAPQKNHTNATNASLYIPLFWT